MWWILACADELPMWPELQHFPTTSLRSEIAIQPTLAGCEWTVDYGHYERVWETDELGRTTSARSRWFDGGGTSHSTTFSTSWERTCPVRQVLEEVYDFGDEEPTTRLVVGEGACDRADHVSSYSVVESWSTGGEAAEDVHSYIDVRINRYGPEGSWTGWADEDGVRRLKFDDTRLLATGHESDGETVWSTELTWEGDHVVAWGESTWTWDGDRLLEEVEVGELSWVSYAYAYSYDDADDLPDRVSLTTEGHDTTTDPSGTPDLLNPPDIGEIRWDCG